MVDIPEGDGFIDISVGNLHSLALRKDGSIAAWGWDLRNEVSDTPLENEFTAIAAGYGHSLALHRDGSIVGWGWDRMD